MFMQPPSVGFGNTALSSSMDKCDIDNELWNDLSSLHVSSRNNVYTPLYPDLTLLATKQIWDISACGTNCTSSEIKNKINENIHTFSEIKIVTARTNFSSSEVSTFNPSYNANQVAYNTNQVAIANDHAKPAKIEVEINQQSSSSINKSNVTHIHSVSPHSLLRGNCFTAFPNKSDNTNDGTDGPMSPTFLSSICDDLCYHVKKGFLFIINNVNFRDRVTPRYNADDDVKKAKAFFQSVGFQCDEHLDLTKSKMEEYCKRVAMNPGIAKYDCFVVLISSHGGEDGILGVDSETVSVSDIVDIFKSKNCMFPVHKPKLFLIQACRGDDDDDGRKYVESDSGERVPRIYKDNEDGINLKKMPTDANIMLAYATTEGRSAHSYVYSPFNRNHADNAGSWFLTCLMGMLERYAKTEDLMTIMTRVNRAMIYYGDKCGGKKQISSQVSQLTYKLYFTFKDVSKL